MVKWYVRGLGLKGEDMLFPRMRHSKGGGVFPIKGLAVSYGSAAGQLKAEVKRLGLGDISLHFGRTEAATAGAMAGSVGSSSRPAGGGRATLWTSGPNVKWARGQGGQGPSGPEAKWARGLVGQRSRGPEAKCVRGRVG